MKAKFKKYKINSPLELLGKYIGYYYKDSHPELMYVEAKKITCLFQYGFYVDDDRYSNKEYYYSHLFNPDWTVLIGDVEPNKTLCIENAYELVLTDKFWKLQHEVEDRWDATLDLSCIRGF